MRFVESRSRASQVRSAVALEISVIQMVNTCNGGAKKGNLWRENKSVALASIWISRKRQHTIEK